eukprot:gene8590-10569_t
MFPWKNKTPSNLQQSQSQSQLSSSPGGTNPVLSSSAAGTPTTSTTTTPPVPTNINPLSQAQSFKPPLGSNSSNSSLNSNHHHQNNNELSSLSSSSGTPTLSQTLSSNLLTIHGVNNNINQSNTPTILNGLPINPSSENGPPILSKLVKSLLAKGVDYENIFKPHPELDNEFQTVKKNLLKDLSIDIEQVQLSTFTTNPYIIAELLKQYLLSLPEPLFSFNLYDSFLLTHSILSPKDRKWAYRYLLFYLPPGFKAAIKQVLGLLLKVHANFSSTRIDSQLLSSMFASVFLRPEEEMYYMKSDRTTVDEIIRLWIEEFEDICKPPTGSNQKITTILSSISPSSTISSSSHHHHHHHQQQQQQSNSGDFSHPLAPTSTISSNHPTIGLNKIITQQTQLQNATNPQQNPKLSLPTIPKQQNTQQTTIIKVKAPLQASSSQSNVLKSNNNNNVPTQSSSTPSSSNSNVSTTSPSATPTPTTTTTPSTPSTTTNSNTATTNASPSKQSTSSSSSTTPSSSSNKKENNEQQPSINISTDGSTTNITFTPISTLDNELTEKVNKIKNSIDSVISEQVISQLRAIGKNIEKELSYNSTIKLSTSLRDSKKHLIETTEKLLQSPKTEVKSFIHHNPKPQSFIINTQNQHHQHYHPKSTQQMTGPDEVEEKKLFELKRASYLALEEISDYIYFYKVKINQFQYKEQIVMTAKIISKLKSILESSPSTNSNSAGNNSSSTNPSSTSSMTNPLSTSISSPESSPSSSPSLKRRSGYYPNIDDFRTTLRIVEVCSKEIGDRLKTMKKELENANKEKGVEIAKAIRTTKQTLHELYVENQYQLPVDIKVQQSDNEDQLTFLKKTLEPLFDRILQQVDDVGKIVMNNTGTEQECKNIVDKLLFINKVLSL